MTTGGWRYALASVMGTGHGRHEQPCQDASGCRLLITTDGRAVLAAVVADGAGSAVHSAIGAELACTLFLDEMTTLFAGGGRVQDIDRPFIAAWLTHFQHAVAFRAEAVGDQPRDFACTLLAAVVGEEAAAFLQVGDGAIVVAASREPDEYSWIFWPQRGEYENVTVFATDPAAADYLEHEIAARRFEELALFTDGLQRLTLHFASQEVHNPFFRPMFAHLRTAVPGYLAETSDTLAAFLDSPAVNDRTDDDKTLLLATRRPAMPPETPTEPMDGAAADEDDADPTGGGQPVDDHGS